MAVEMERGNGFKAHLKFMLTVLYAENKRTEDRGLPNWVRVAFTDVGNTERGPTLWVNGLVVGCELAWDRQGAVGEGNSGW